MVNFMCLVTKQIDSFFNVYLLLTDAIKDIMFAEAYKFLPFQGIFVTVKQYYLTLSLE